MKLALLSLLLPLLAMPCALAEEFAVATIDVRKIFDDWQYSIDSKANIEKKQAEIEEENNVRLAVINKLQMQRAKMHKEYQDNAATMTNEQKTEMDRKFRGMGRDAVALEQDRRDFFQKSRRMLNDEITSEANLILDRITQATQAYAQEKKLAMVIEIGGETTTNVPFFIHLEGAKDITDEIIKRLNDDGEEDKDEDGDEDE